MKSKSVEELKQMMDNKEDFQLIDVRESYEVEICTLGGVHIPMGNIINEADKIKKDVPVIVHCRSGKRSANVIQALESKGFNNLYNLEGGILAYANEIDDSLETY